MCFLSNAYEINRREEKFQFLKNLKKSVHICK